MVKGKIEFWKSWKSNLSPTEIPMVAISFTPWISIWLHWKVLERKKKYIIIIIFHIIMFSTVEIYTLQTIHQSFEN